MRKLKHQRGQHKGMGGHTYLRCLLSVDHLQRARVLEWKQHRSSPHHSPPQSRMTMAWVQVRDFKELSQGFFFLQEEEEEEEEEEKTCPMCGGREQP